MEQRTLYIAAVLTFTLLPIDVQSVTCQNAEYVPVGEVCYRQYSLHVSWTKARDNCKSLKGKLATFTSFNHMDEVFTTLGYSGYFWVDAPNESEEVGSRCAAVHSSISVEYFIYSDTCDAPEFSSLCIELCNNNSDNKTATTTTQTIDLTNKKEICLHKDSVSVDGQCYRLSAEALYWSNASEYCNSWNATVASFSSVNEGFKILKAIGPMDFYIWISDFVSKDKALFVYIQIIDACKIYKFGQYLKDTGEIRLQVLCMELPSTTTPEKTTAPASTTISELTTAPALSHSPEMNTTLESTTTPESNKKLDLTTEPKSNTKQKSTTTPKSDAPRLGQNKLGNQNKLSQGELVEQNRLHYQIGLVFNYYRLIED